MAFLKNIFKRKPGGTLIGNALRSVASKLTGGIIGDDFLKISQEDADKRDLTDDQFAAKYGKTKSGMVVNSTLNAAVQQQIATTGTAGPSDVNAPTTFSQKASAWLKTTTGKIVMWGSIVGIAALVIWKMTKGKGGKKRRSY